MGPFIRHLELPLLAKELNEQSARQRTYVIRFVYAGLLFGVVCGLFYGSFASGINTGEIFGQGLLMFDGLISLQFWGIVLFLPAMACGALTYEKERDCLGLLLVTSLTPWDIILQKLLGRLIPVVTFLFLSFPLMAIAYSYGGVTENHLWTGILLLLLTCLQIGSLSVMCSAFFRTTSEAFVATYVILLVLCFCCFPVTFLPWVYDTATAVGPTGTVLYMIPMMLSIVAFLVLARISLVARAFVPPKNVSLQFLHGLDRFFEGMNQMTGGVVLVKDSQKLPSDEAIAWRETTKKSLGTFRYLFRVLVVLELPAFFLAASETRALRSASDALIGFLYILWGVSVAFIAVQAAGLISSERLRQTLDVLLTTPLSGREIVLQKFRGVRRLIFVFLIPFLTIFFLSDFIRAVHSGENLLLSLLTVGVYLPLAAWLSMWIGFRIRSQMRAIVVTILLFVVWVAYPPAMRYVFDAVFMDSIPEAARYLLLLSPASIIPAIAHADPQECGLPRSPEPYYALNFLVYGGLLFYFRRLCLGRADYRLGRVGDEESRALEQSLVNSTRNKGRLHT